MAIAFKSKKYNSIAIDSNMVIGVVGDYIDFINSLEGDNISFLNNNYDNLIIDDNYFEYRKLLNIDSFINKNANDLSHSEKRLLEYYKMIIKDSKIMVLLEPYVYLDYSETKNINLIINKLIKDRKTIIIGSADINNIYSLCKKVLIVKDRELIYDNINCLNDIELLNKYNLDIPNIVEFIELAKVKNIKLPYSKDIRDLIKDVYRNV